MATDLGALEGERVLYNPTEIVFLGPIPDLPWEEHEWVQEDMIHDGEDQCEKAIT